MSPTLDHQSRSGATGQHQIALIVTSGSNNPCRQSAPCSLREPALSGSPEMPTTSSSSTYRERERERERDGSLRNGGSPAVEGRQGNELDHRRQAHRGTVSGKDTFPTICANCGDKQWLGNQEAFSGDYFIKEPR